MEPKHRKILLICVGIVIASYIVRSVVITVMQMAYYQQQAIRAAQLRQARAKPAPPPVTKPTPADAPAPPATPAPNMPASLMNLSGVWAGQAALRGKGLCDLRFELREKKDEPGHFTGSPSMTCVGYGPLVVRPDATSIIMNRRDPEAVLLTGGVEKDSLQFHVDKVVATNSNGCAPTSFSLTPFGDRFLAAEWQEGTCPGGHMFLHKVGR